jgi:hypothetical protein
MLHVGRAGIIWLFMSFPSNVFDLLHLILPRVISSNSSNSQKNHEGKHRRRSDARYSGNSKRIILYPFKPSS